MKRLSEDIRTGNFKRVYLLFGEEGRFRVLAKQNLISALVPSDDEMNLTVFSEKGCDEQKIIEICDTLPFFAERRVVVLENSRFFKEKRERITEYIKHIPEYLVILFVEQEVDKRSALYKAVAKAGTAVEFKRLSEKDLSDWLLVKISRSGKKIRRPEMELFLSYVGDDAGIAECELEKLICYIGDRDVIRKEDIEEICVRSLENRIFDMLTDMTMGRKRKALDEYRDLLLMKEEPMRILYMMGRQYDQLLKIRELSAEGMTEKRIAEAAGIHPYAVKKGLPISRHYTVSQLRGILEEFVQTEEDVKTGRLAGNLAVELMLLGK